MTTAGALPYLLTGYSLPYTLGYITLKDGTPNPSPWTLNELVDRVIELNLAGIEAPLTNRVPSFEGKIVELNADLDQLTSRLREERLHVVADSGIVVDDSAEHLIEYLRLAHRLGAKVVRAIISDLLCGDRRPVPGGWPSRLQETAARLRDVLPIAEELGLAIAIENHQDATSDDLLRLFERVNQSPAFGITLDTGNPLANGEDPVEMCRRIAPLIRHVHLKDYTIHYAPNGYRLVRCVAGEGVIDFPSILRIVRANGHDVIPGIEIAAQATRTIPFLEHEWWSTYPERSSVDLLGPLQILWKSGHPMNEPYASRWEQGASGSSVIEDEWQTFVRSVEYFRNLELRLDD